MRAPLRLAVIGCALGRTRYHLAISATPAVTLAGLADNDPNVTRVWAREAGSKVPAYADVASLLDAPDTYDAVLVASPLGDRAEHLLAALRAGKPVLAECPFAPALSDADTVRKRTQTSGAFLLPALPRRFDPYFLAATEQLRLGAISRVTQIRCHWSFPLENVDETEDVVTGGWNALIQTLGSQTADVCRWWQGEGLTVSGDVDLSALCGRTRDPRRLPADQALANFILTQEQGQSTHHLARTRAVQPDERYLFSGASGEMELIISAGAAASTASAPLLRVHPHGQKPQTINVGTRPTFAGKTPLSPAVQRIQNLLAHFADCVQLGDAPRVTPDDAYAALEIVQAAYVSTQEGLKINLPLRRVPDIARMLLPSASAFPLLPPDKQI